MLIVYPDKDLKSMYQHRLDVFYDIRPFPRNDHNRATQSVPSSSRVFERTRHSTGCASRTHHSFHFT